MSLVRGLEPVILETRAKSVTTPPTVDVEHAFEPLEERWDEAQLTGPKRAELALHQFDLSYLAREGRRRLLPDLREEALWKAVTIYALSRLEAARKQEPNLEPKLREVDATVGEVEAFLTHLTARTGYLEAAVQAELQGQIFIEPVVLDRDDNPWLDLTAPRNPNKGPGWDLLRLAACELGEPNAAALADALVAARAGEPSRVDRELRLALAKAILEIATATEIQLDERKFPWSIPRLTSLRRPVTDEIDLRDLVNPLPEAVEVVRRGFGPLVVTDVQRGQLTHHAADVVYDVISPPFERRQVRSSRA